MLKLPISRKTIFIRSIKGLCPNCGQNKISNSWLLINPNCKSCGMNIKRGNGFYIGPICINYGFVAFVLISPLIILGFHFDVHLYFTLGLSILISIFFPILLYPVSWNIWLMVYYICLPGELFENRPKTSDDLLFDEDIRI